MIKEAAAAHESDQSSTLSLFIQIHWPVIRFSLLNWFSTAGPDEALTAHVALMAHLQLQQSSVWHLLNTSFFQETNPVHLWHLITADGGVFSEQVSAIFGRRLELERISSLDPTEDKPWYRLVNHKLATNLKCSLL